jgi:hypothetical protein
MCDAHACAARTIENRERNSSAASPSNELLILLKHVLAQLRKAPHDMPMLGELLEISITADSMPSAAASFRAMGFREADVGNIVSEAYLPVAIDGITVGLREAGSTWPIPIFVRPRLKEHVRAFRHLDIQPTFMNLADDEFHRVGIEDPNGLPIMLVEARTYSPLAGNVPGIIGEFVEFSLPTHSIEASLAFWQKLGFTSDPEMEPTETHHRLLGHGLAIGFHSGTRFVAGLTFAGANLDGRVAYLKAKGCSISAGAPIAPRAHPAATVQIPGAGPLYLIERN